MQLIVVYIECLRADHLSCYGYLRQTTPFLDSIVESNRGIMWADCKALGSDTRATFTRLAPTIQELTSRGVHTTFYSGNYPIIPPSVFGAFRHYQQYPAMHLEPSVRPITARIIDDFVSVHGKAEDFVAILHLPETHAPYQDHDQVQQFLGDPLYQDQRARLPIFPREMLLKMDRFEGLLVAQGPDTLIWHRPGHSRKHGLPVATHPAYYVAAYDGAIRFIDSCLARLFEAFPTAEIYVTGDHGEGLGERGRWCSHGGPLWPELTQVPLVARTERPLPFEARVASEPVTHAHLYATMLKAFGGETQAKDLPWPTLEGYDDEAVRRLRGMGYIDRAS